MKTSSLKKAGNGLFSARRFKTDDIISVYLGKLVQNKKGNTAYKMDFGALGSIDPGKGIG